jgi:hypothetical protein
MASEAAGDFTLIVASVAPDSLTEAAGKFARAFNLEDSVATAGCKGAPIVFAQKLTKQEVKAITPLLTDLSAAGMEFRITARLAQKLPKLNWPVRPAFTAGNIPAAAGLAFEWDHNAFVCPGCGESFLFRRLGQLKLVEPPAEPVAGNGTAAAIVKKAPARVPVAAGSYSAEDTRPTPKAVGVEGLSSIPGEGESLDFPEAEEEARLPDPEPLLPAPEPEPELLDEPEPLAPAEPEAVEDLGSGLEAAPAEPEPVAEELPEAPLEEEAPPAETGELYNVFLSKITDTSKRDKASELISKIKGCTPAEAKELTTRLVIPLAKNVPKSKAEDILNQFKKMKIFGRMTKVK